VTPSLRPLVRARLADVVPTLLQDRALVALVPDTGDLSWAARAAWDVARAATRGGRRVALVDLSVEDPILHKVAGVEAKEGIVDAFEYEVSLSKTAHLVDGVHFIAAGSYTAKAGDLYAHPRWRRLQAGFRSENALLLLYLPASGLERCSATPDGVVVLSPDGSTLTSPAGQIVAGALARGAPPIGVVQERWTQAPAAPQTPRRASAPPIAKPPLARRLRPVFIALGLALSGATGWALLARGAEHPRAPLIPASPAADPVPHHAPAPVPQPADTLGWSVQLAAYGASAKALGDADQLARAGVPAYVTPVAAPGRRTVWYRVIAGARKTRAGAALLRDSLWASGLAPRGQGDLLFAPYSLTLSGDCGALRARGVPVVGVASGDAACWVGAFETPEQAAAARAMLTRDGLTATLVTRQGTTP